MDIKAAFQPAYQLPEKELRWVDYLFAKLSRIIGRLPVQRDLLVNEIRQTALVRAAYSSALNDASCANIPVDRILNHILEDNHLCLEIGQYQDLEIHLEKLADKDFSIVLLQETARFFELRTADVNLFAFGNKDLFSAKGHSGKEDELAALFTFVQESPVHPVVVSWIFHAELLRIAPFTAFNDKVARVLQYHYLNHKQYTLAGFLHLELEDFLHKKRYYETLEQLNRTREYSGIISMGMLLIQQNLQRVENLLKTLYRRTIDYQGMPPRQRNQINYIFDRGFELRQRDNKLNGRQQKIMEFILQQGSVSTKELTDQFACNRKTIQRDFADLLEQDLVTISGNGSALRYTLNMKDRDKHELSAYQTIPLDPLRISEQPSLFDEDPELIHKNALIV